MQFSINSTDNTQRNVMFNNMSLSLEEISEISKQLPTPVGRKYTLNFAVTKDTILNAKRLSELFDKSKFIVKITPIHETNNAKENGYRSYHLVVEVLDEEPDIRGNSPGRYYVEIQLRTIAMDSWASLEHQMKYKREIANAGIISRELKRCADELAACDISMQTIRQLIHES